MERHAVIPGSPYKCIYAFMKSPFATAYPALLPRSVCSSSQTKVICVRQWRESGSELVHIWTPKGMGTSQTSKKDMIIQDHNIANSIFRMKPPSCICDEYGLYTEKFKDSYRKRDSLYRVSLEIAI